MANITKYLEQKLLAQSVGQITNFSVTGGNPGATYAALYTVTPTVNYVNSTAEDGQEVVATDYSRKPITWGAAAANSDTTNSSSIKNSSSIAWSSITSNWLTVTTICVFDSSVKGEGNLLWFGPLSSPVTLSIGDTFTLPANSLTLTLG